MTQWSEGLSDDPVENLERFVAEVVQDGRVWGLRDEDGWAILDSMRRDGDDVMPFWSTEDFAFDAATDEWLEYEVASVSLASFLASFLVQMAQEGCLVGPNWRGESTGAEIDASDMIDALRQAAG